MTHYNDLNTYYKQRFGYKIYKLSINAGLTCPNRDGTLGTSGCIFCSAGGSGDFAADSRLSITEQINFAKQLVSQKISDGKYIAYFQAFTNTYGDISYLRKIFYEAISLDDIVALSIATRPDCLPPEVLSLLNELNQIKPVFVELGLQSIHESTAIYINRGYSLDCYDTAVLSLKQLGINVVTHIIIGLPNETAYDLLATIKHISKIGTDGVKLQLLHILKNTRLALDYEQGSFEALSFEEYVDLLIMCIENLPPRVVIHRITGDGDKRKLIAPTWSANKRKVLNDINRIFREKNVIQGKKYI